MLYLILAVVFHYGSTEAKPDVALVPVPSLAVCERAGQLFVKEQNTKSDVQSASYRCLAIDPNAQKV